MPTLLLLVMQHSASHNSPSSLRLRGDDIIAYTTTTVRHATLSLSQFPSLRRRPFDDMIAYTTTVMSYNTQPLTSHLPSFVYELSDDIIAYTTTTTV